MGGGPGIVRGCVLGMVVAQQEVLEPRWTMAWGSVWEPKHPRRLSTHAVVGGSNGRSGKYSGTGVINE